MTAPGTILRIAAAKIGTRWWISLPEHEGDLKDFKPPEAKTDLPAKTAKSAKSSSPGEVGGLGGVDSEEVSPVQALIDAGFTDHGEQE